MIERVLHATSKDLSRLALTGVLWEFDKTKFAMVATDGHRLAKTVRYGEGAGRRRQGSRSCPRRRSSRCRS